MTQLSFQINCTFQAQPRIVFNWRQPVWEVDIWTVNLDGTNLRQLTRGGSSLLPKRSPDGTRIVFSSARSFRVMNFDGTEQRIGFSQGQTPASWTGDGEKIVFCEENHLTVINASGGSSVRLAEDFGSLGCEAPVWSPDDHEIAFSRRGDIWRIGADGTGLTRLAVGGDYAYASYSSDGNSIIFHSGSTSLQPAERARIMDVDGGNLRPFAALLGIGVQQLRWWQP